MRTTNNLIKHQKFINHLFIILISYVKLLKDLYHKTLFTKLDEGIPKKTEEQQLG